MAEPPTGARTFRWRSNTVGNLLGALAAGLLLGLAETAVARLIDPGLTLAANYLLFLAVLLWRPTGLFGSPTR